MIALSQMMKLAEMKRLLHEAMQEGRNGYVGCIDSTHLATYQSTEELVELCKVVGRTQWHVHLAYPQRRRTVYGSVG